MSLIKNKQSSRGVFRHFFRCSAALLATGLNMTSAYSQELDSDTLTKVDNQFWKAYNSCDIRKLETFLKPDVEFYHDKDGILLTSKALIETIKTNLCSKSGMRLRREAISGSQSIHPLGSVGAIMSGDHIFHMRMPGQDERPDSGAKFIHVWLYEYESWKLSRIFSFDHKTIPFSHEVTGFSLSAKQLEAYAGKYTLAQMGKVTVKLDNNVLLMQTDGFEAKIHPESETHFYVKEMPLTFHFKQNRSGAIVGFDVLENGKKVDSAKRAK